MTGRDGGVGPTWPYAADGDDGAAGAGDGPDERHVALTRGVRSTAGIPDDARAMGLDRNTPEGAMIGMAGSLSSARLSHRILAWILLAVLILPLLYNVLRQLAWML